MKITVAHTADHFNRYPGETVTLHTRVEALEKIEGFTLRIQLPPDYTVTDYRPPPNDSQAMPRLETTPTQNYLVWRVDDDVPIGGSFEYQSMIAIPGTQHNTHLETIATATAAGNNPPATETATVAITAKGRYLQYLPAIYQDDDLMGRFLMLFESFWKPIDQQIDTMWYYFDPQMTTPDFIPWLAGWIGLALDEHWPESKRRQLLTRAASLYRKRGTRQGLQEFLQIYTGVEAQIVEHRAANFQLGGAARLGAGIALGKDNQPHTFTVRLILPPIETGPKAERKRQETMRRRTIESIIEAEKPAHTSYTLHLETEKR